MKVIVAEVAGMCFGVRDALEVLDQIDRPEAVTIHGQLVHNEHVLTQLGSRGFRMVTREQDRPLPGTGTVLITAHGISEAERKRLADAGKRLVDTTCPLVRRAHDAAQRLQRDGYFVLVLGRRGHVEVQGIVEDLHHYEVVQHPDEVRDYGHQRLGIMCQTTTPARLVSSIREAIAQQNPDADIRFIDTVCHPTKDHQKALDQLIDQVDAVVVVGGRNSNNTRELVTRCRDQGRTAFHIQSAADLREEWFEDIDVVGLTAGTSTLDSTINEVHKALQCMSEQPSRKSSQREAVKMM